METWKKVSVAAVGALVVLAAIMFLLPGDDGDNGDAPDGSQGDVSSGTHECETGQFQQQGGQWGGLGCEHASGHGVFSDTFECQVPEESAIGGSLQEATEGTLTLTVDDADGDTVHEDTYQAGAHPIGDFIGDGAAGEWTVTVEFSSDWESGQIGIGAGCSTESDDGGQPSSPTGCQTTSDQRMQGTSMGQISCRDQQGEDDHEATFQCDVPEQGQANWDADLQAGTVEIQIVDGDGEILVEETLESDESGFTSLEGGATGEWTLTAQRSSSFEGSFNVGGQCPVE